MLNHQFDKIDCLDMLHEKTNWKSFRIFKYVLGCIFIYILGCMCTRLISDKVMEAVYIHPKEYLRMYADRHPRTYVNIHNKRNLRMYV